MQHIELGKYVNVHYVCFIIYHWLVKMQQMFFKSLQSVAVSVMLHHHQSSVLLVHVSGELQAGCVILHFLSDPAVSDE